MTDTSEAKVVGLADTIRAVCANQPVNISGPAVILALHALLQDTGAPKEQLTAVADELMRRLGRMINAPRPS